jgi:predicted DNA-binding transcriptional regulator YafY
MPRKPKPAESVPPPEIEEFYRIPLTTGEALATLASLKALLHLADTLDNEDGTNSVLETGILESAISRLENEMPDFAVGQAERLSGSLAAGLRQAGLGASEAGYNGQADRSEPPFYTKRTRRLLEEAQERSVPVEIEYYVRSREEWTTRPIDIMDVYEEDEGDWYLRGHCRLRNDTRQFRLDHIRAVRVLEDADDSDDLPNPFMEEAGTEKKGDGATHGTGAARGRRRRRRSPASSTD